MDIKRLKERLEDYKNVLNRLNESLGLEVSSSVIMDGVIQRFEFTYELAWKVLKDYLEFVGIPETRSSRDTFKEGFKAGIIKDGDAWLDMLQDRNLTAHTYNETLIHTADICCDIRISAKLRQKYGSLFDVHDISFYSW